ncbi:uncharacterized protein LOC127711056 [Mytilus californianus]|uniref:uncharacterized protein LOC127711056 n=1 Tax=Mytilus californianus TaxID=6549 RepID=UPI002247C4D9|nr:uncharacterized protein LOC127711056 [Mytilus californianus]
MSDIETKEYLKIVKVSFDLSPKIVRAYTRTKVLTPKFDGSIIACLDSCTVKHNIYHAYKGGERCCECNDQYTRPSKSAQEWIFKKLYYQDVNAKCNKTKRNCLCMLHAKEDITLEELDLPVLCVILEGNGAAHQDIEKLSKLRNKICHVPSTQSVGIEKCRDIWQTMEKSIIAIARLVDPNWYDMVKDQIKNIQKFSFDDDDVKELNGKVDKYIQLVKIESIEVKKHVSAEIGTVREDLQQIKKEVKEESQKVIAALEEKISPVKEEQATFKRCIHNIDGKTNILLDAINSRNRLDAINKRNRELHQAYYSQFNSLPEEIYFIHASHLFRNSGIYSHPLQQTLYRPETSYRQMFPFSVPANLKELELEIRNLVFKIQLKGIEEHFAMVDIPSLANATLYVQWILYTCPTFKWKMSQVLKTPEKELWYTPPLFKIQSLSKEEPYIFHTSVTGKVFNNWTEFHKAVSSFLEHIVTVCNIETKDRTFVRVDFILLSGPVSDYSKRFLKTGEEMKESDEDSSTTTEMSDTVSESEMKKAKIKADEESVNECSIDTETEEGLIDTKKTQILIPQWKKEMERIDKEIRTGHIVVRKLENAKVGSAGHGTDYIKMLNTKSRLDHLRKRKQVKKNLIKAYEKTLQLQESKKDLHKEADVFGYNYEIIMCLSCKTTREENLLCWCKECSMVLCDSCSAEHRISTKDHTIVYSPNITFGYKLERSFKIESLLGMIEDVKFVSRDNIVMLNVWNEQLIVCHLDGTNQRDISLNIEDLSAEAMPNQDLQMSHQIAVIDDTIVAVSLCRYRTVVLVDIINGLITKNIPIERLTGGIAVMDKRLLVCAETEVLEVNISIQNEDNNIEPKHIMNVSDTKILFSVDDVNLCCVHYNQRISCFNMNGQQLNAFSTSPFNFQSMTLDEEKNILFMDGSNVKQTRTDGTNTKTVITLPKPEDHSNSESTALCWMPARKFIIVTRYDTVYVYKKI